jgi:hypothetical protein
MFVVCGGVADRRPVRLRRRARRPRAGAADQRRRLPQRQHGAQRVADAAARAGDQDAVCGGDVRGAGQADGEAP